MTEEMFAPVFRVSDTGAAVAWYRRLGFIVEYEHASGSGFTRTTVALKRGELGLILSNREEDGGPGGLAVLRVLNIDEVAGAFNVEVNDTGTARHMELRDPDGNRIRVVTPKYSRQKNPV